MLRTILTIVGLLMAAMGLLWIGQGLGWVRGKFQRHTDKAAGVIAHTLNLAGVEVW